MKNAVRHMSVSIFWFALVVSVLAAPAYAETSRDVSSYDKLIQNSLNTHCTECHDQETQKGKVRLDNWLNSQEAEKVSLIDRVMEQVFHEVMPPKKKNALTADQQKTLFDAINQRHVITQTTSEFSERLSEKLKRPGYGNYVDHEQLFSGANKNIPGFTYDRDWLISEFIFTEKINALLALNTKQRIDGKEYITRGTRLDPKIVNPFTLPRDSGVRYYASDKINSSHFLTMMGNAKYAANVMVGHLSRTQPGYLPAVTAMTKLKFEHDAILASRKAFMDQWIDALCAEVHGSQHEAMLPTYTKIELDGEISEKLNTYGKNGWTGRIGVNSPYILPGITRFARPGKDKLQIIRECERFWFHMGYDKDMVARLVNNLRLEVASILAHRAEAMTMPKRTNPNGAELAEINSTIKALRTKGMTYLQVIDACMRHWNTEFEQIREKSQGPNDELMRNVLVELYQKLFERQPTQDEAKDKQTLLRTYAAKKGIDGAVTRLTETLLLDSEFITRYEHGVGKADEHGRRMLSPRDASYAIAYALTDNPPDAVLAKAAQEGRLNTRDDYKRAVERLLQDRSQFYIIDNDINDIDGVDHFTNLPIRKLRFFREFFGYYTALDVFKDQTRFGARLPATRERLIAEADMLVENILTNDQHVIETLLTTDRFYVYHSGDNTKVLQTSNQIKKVYDYFKSKNWKQFRGPEDMLAHKDFILAEGLPGFPVNELKGLDSGSVANKKIPKEDGTKKKEEAAPGEKGKAGRKDRSTKEKEAPSPGDGLFIRFINALCDLEEKFEGQYKYIVPSMLGGVTTRMSAKTDVLMAGANVAQYFNINQNRWDYPPEQPAKIDHRLGMLTHPAWLQAFSKNDHTDPVIRGKWIREKLLAKTLPDIPIGVDAVVPDDHTRTLRARLESVTSKAECSKCHQYMNPLGNAFEMYDDFGRFRTQEELEHPDNAVGVQEISHHKMELAKIHPSRQKLGRPGLYVSPRILYKTLPVNTTGELMGTGDKALDGEVKDALDLIGRLAKSQRVRQSIIRHAFRYFLGRNEMLSDSKTLIDAEQAYLKNGGSFDAVIVALLTSDSFILRKQPQE